jgi:hypothetical protein
MKIAKMKFTTTAAENAAHFWHRTGMPDRRKLMSLIARGKSSANLPENTE